MGKLGESNAILLSENKLGTLSNFSIMIDELLIKLDAT